MSNIPKKNGNLLQCHLTFLQKAKERRRWSVASIPSSGYGTTTPASSNSQCSLNTEDHYACSCLHSQHHNHSQIQPYTNISASPKLYHSNIAGTLAQHYSSNDSNPSLNDGEDRHLSTLQYFRPRSRSLSSPVRSPALDSKSTLDSSTSKENLIQLPIIPGTLTFRRRSRSLNSPIRSPGVENRFIQMNHVYKERFPNAINQMNEKLEKFIQDNPELIPEVASDAVTRFVHHQAIEVAKDCLQKSKDELLTSHYFHEMSENLDKLMIECREKSTLAAQHLKKLIKQLLLIVSRPARLLECLEFNPEEFYRFLEAAEGQAKSVQGIKTDLPQYIISKLGLNKDPLTEFKQLDEQLNDDNDEKLIDDDKTDEQKNDQIVQRTVKLPNEKDYETIKLISNGAYGAVYLVRHKETNQRYAMKKINKQNLALRNQIEQAFAERDIMCFTDNPFVVSLFCSFETKNYLCMVMEYVEGGDCATLLKNMGPLPIDLAKFYFAEAVLAVEYIHSYGIVHRDLKSPDNLLITSLGHIKLTDFGLSKIGLMNLTTNLYEGFIDRETKQFNDNQVCGTAEYIAPEVILRQGYGKPVDWWSMGIILYEFVIGVVPWSGDSSAEELFSHVINDEIEWPSDEDWPLPEELKLIITQLLMPNPIDRLGTQGANEVKEHPFFNGLNWDALLRQKAEFVPQLNDEYDTSYFDTRLDRYNHELDDSEGLNDSDDSPLFSSFSSFSPRYHRMYSKLEKDLDDDKPTKSSSTLSISLIDDSNSRKSSAEEKEIKSSLSIDESSTVCPIINKKEIKCRKDLNNELLTESMVKDGSNGNKTNVAKFLTSNFTPDSSQTESQTESEDYSPLMQRRRKTSDSNKEMPKFNIEMPVKEEESENPNAANETNRPLTPSIKETPPDDSTNEEIESNLNEDNNCLIYDENRLSLSTKIRPVIKSASAHGISQLQPEPIKIQRRYTQPDHRQQLEESGGSGMFSDNSTNSSTHDQSDIIKSCLNKSLLSRIESPSRQLSNRSSLNVRKSSLRQMSSPYGSSASSRDNSPNHDLIQKRKGSIESQNIDKRRSVADIGCLSNSFSNLSKLKPPVILRKSTRGYGFSFKAIRVYYGDSDVYTMHHLVMNVEPNSPAYESGLKAGDLITHINSEPLQGLLHHQVLQLVLSGDKIEIRTTPLEATSIKTGGRRRNPQQIKLARRGMNRHHSNRKSSYLLSANDQIPSAIPSLSPSVLKRTDSDKRRKNSSLFRRLSSKRASADIQQFLTTSSCLTEASLSSNITPSKSFQHLSPNSKEELSKLDSNDSNTVKNTSLVNTPNNRNTSHLLNQYSISDSSQSSSPNSSVPNSPAALTGNTVLNCSNCCCSNASTPLPTNKAAQSISAAVAQFNRPNTLHGLKYKLVQTLRSPRRKSCGSITTIPLSPLARNERMNSPSCAGCSKAKCIQQQSGNLITIPVSPTRSPSPLAFSNNGQLSNRHSHQFHRQRQMNCSVQANSSNSPFKSSNQASSCSNNSCLSNNPSVNCCSNADCKELAHISGELTDINQMPSLSSTNKKFACSSQHCRAGLNVNDLDLYSIDKSDSRIAQRSKSAEPEAVIMTRRRVSCACDHYDQIYDNQFFMNRHNCNCLKGKTFAQSPLATSLSSQRSANTETSSSAEFSEEHNLESTSDDHQFDHDIQEFTIEKDSESSTASTCSMINMNEKLNEKIETIPEYPSEDVKLKTESPSNTSSINQQQQSTSNQESTISKVKNSPIIVRKTLFKQNSEKRKGSRSKDKES